MTKQGTFSRRCYTEVSSHGLHQANTFSRGLTEVNPMPLTLLVGLGVPQVYAQHIVVQNTIVPLQGPANLRARAGQNLRRAKGPEEENQTGCSKQRRLKWGRTERQGCLTGTGLWW